MHHHNLDKCTRVESSRLSEMCVRERCSGEFLPQPRTDRCNSSIYMRSLAYLSFDFLFGVFCSRISQRSLFLDLRCTTRPYHRASRTRTHEWKTEKWEKSKMDETGSVGCFDDSFFHLTHSPSAVATIFFENENTAFSLEKKCQDLPNACRSLPRPVPAMNNLRKTFSAVFSVHVCERFQTFAFIFLGQIARRFGFDWSVGGIWGIVSGITWLKCG